MEQKFSKIWVNSGSFPSDYKNRKFPVASGTAYSGISGKLDKQDNLVRYTDIFVNSHWEFRSNCSLFGNSTISGFF